MIIFITQKQMIDKHHQTIDALETNYIDYFQETNIFPNEALFIPIVNNLTQIKILVQKIKPDIIIFTGGNDVKPKDNNSIDGDFVPRRDEVENFLIIIL
jgi:gamma-glutamyl-gamma-aminobutyrate hydrolase PuuD